MAGINITAQLQGPTNMRAFVQNIQSQLNGIRANINLNISSSAAASLNQLSTSLAQLSTGVNTLNATMSRVGPVVNNVTNNINNLSNVTNRVTSSLSRTRAAFTDTTSSMENFGQVAGLATRRFLGFSLAAGSIIKFTSSLKDGVHQALEFERTMNKIKQVSEGSSEGIKDLEKEISRLATSFGVSSKELADTALTLRQAGLSINEVKTAMEALAKASLTPTFDGMGKTVEGVIAIMSQFKVQAKDVEAALGSINAASAAFAVESSDIIEAVKRSGGAFKSVGGELNEFIALFTAVRSTTRESADNIATGLRTIFTRLQRNDTVEALKALQINLRFTREEAARMGDSGLENQFVGAYEAVKRLGEGLKGLRSTDPRYSAVVEQLGGYRQISRVIPLLQEATTIQKAYTVAQNGQISVSVAAATAQESYLIKMEKVKQQFLELMRTFANSGSFKTIIDSSLSLASAVIKITDALTPLLPMLTTLAAIKIGQGISSFGAGFFGGVSGKSNPRLFAAGGHVDGHGYGDSVDAKLTPGEYVLDRNSVEKMGGARNIDSMRKKFATGGLLPSQKIGQAFIQPTTSSSFSTGTLKVSELSKRPTNKLKGNIDANLDESITGAAREKAIKHVLNRGKDSTISGNVHNLTFTGAAKLPFQIRERVFPDLKDSMIKSVQNISGRVFREDDHSILPQQIYNTLSGSMSEALFSTYGRLKSAGGGSSVDFSRIPSGAMAKMIERGFLSGRSDVNNIDIKSTQVPASELINKAAGASNDIIDFPRLARAMIVDDSRFVTGNIQTKKHGKIQKPLFFANGGVVPGSGHGDTERANLQAGSFVMRRSSTDSIGVGNLQRFANGGMVQRLGNGDEVFEWNMKPTKNQDGETSYTSFTNPYRFSLAQTEALSRDIRLMPEKDIYDKLGIDKRKQGLGKNNIKPTSTEIGRKGNSLNIPDSPADRMGIITSGPANRAGYNKFISATPSSMSEKQMDKLRKEGIDLTKVKLIADAHVISKNKQEEFSGNFTEKISSEITSALSKQFPGQSGLSLNNQEKSNISGILLGKYISGITKVTGASKSNEDWDFEPGAFKPGSNYPFLFPSTIMARHIDVKQNPDHINRIAGKYLNLPHIKAQGFDRGDYSQFEGGGISQSFIDSQKTKDPALYKRLMAQKTGQKFASGGHASGRDTVPAMLTPGEFVFNPQAVSRIGLGKLHEMNQTGKVQHFAKGGYVGGEEKPFFKYEALDASGNEIRSTIGAYSQEHVQAYANSENEFITKATRINKKGTMSEELGDAHGKAFLSQRNLDQHLSDVAYGRPTKGSEADLTQKRDEAQANLAKEKEIHEARKLNPNISRDDVKSIINQANTLKENQEKIKAHNENYNAAIAALEKEIESDKEGVKTTKIAIKNRDKGIKSDEKDIKNLQNNRSTEFDSIEENRKKEAAARQNTGRLGRAVNFRVREYQALEERHANSVDPDEQARIQLMMDKKAESIANTRARQRDSFIKEGSYRQAAISNINNVTNIDKELAAKNAALDAKKSDNSLDNKLKDKEEELRLKQAAAKLPKPPVEGIKSLDTINDAIEKQAQKALNLKNGQNIGEGHVDSLTEKKAIENAHSDIKAQLVAAEKARLRAIDSTMSKDMAHALAVEGVDAALRKNLPIVTDASGKVVNFAVSATSSTKALNHLAQTAEAGAVKAGTVGGTINDLNTHTQGKVSTSRWEGFKSRLGGMGMMGAGMGLGYAAEAFGPKSNMTEEQIASSSSYSSQKGLSGALTGASSGMMMGMVAGAPGMILGATVGLLAGLVGSMKEAEQEISRANIAVAAKDLANALSNGISGARAITSINKIDENMNKETSRTGINGTWAWWKKDDWKIEDNQKFIARRNEVYSQQLPAFSKSLSSSAERIGEQSNGEDIFAAQGGSFSKFEEKLIEGADGLNRQMIQKIAELRGIPIRDVMKEFVESAKMASRKLITENANKAGQEGFNFFISGIGRFNDSLSLASEAGSNFKNKLEDINSELSGQFSHRKMDSQINGINLIGKGSAEFGKSADIISANMGVSGDNFRKIADSIDKVSSELPRIMEGIMSGSYGQGKDPQTAVREQLRDALKVNKEDNASATAVYIEKIVGRMAESGDLKDINKIMNQAGGADKFARGLTQGDRDEVTRQAIEAMTKLSQIVNELGKGMNDYYKTLTLAANEQDKASIVKAEKNKTLASMDALVTGKRDLDIYSMNPFKDKQERLAKGEFDPEKLKASIDQTREKLKGQEKERNDAYKSGNINKQLELTNEIESTNDSLKKFKDALENASNAAKQEVQIALELVKVLQAERAERMGAAETIAFGSSKDRQAQANNFAMAQRAALEGTANMSDSQKAQALAGAKQFNKTRAFKDINGDFVSGQEVINKVAQRNPLIAGGMIDTPEMDDAKIKLQKAFDKEIAVRDEFAKILKEMAEDIKKFSKEEANAKKVAFEDNQRKDDIKNRQAIINNLNEQRKNLGVASPDELNKHKGFSTGGSWTDAEGKERLGINLFDKNNVYQKERFDTANKLAKAAKNRHEALYDDKLGFKVEKDDYIESVFDNNTSKFKSRLKGKNLEDDIAKKLQAMGVKKDVFGLSKNIASNVWGDEDLLKHISGLGEDKFGSKKESLGDKNNYKAILEATVQKYIQSNLANNLEVAGHGDAIHSFIKSQDFRHKDNENKGAETYYDLRDEDKKKVDSAQDFINGMNPEELGRFGTLMQKADGVAGGFDKIKNSIDELDAKIKKLNEEKGGLESKNNGILGKRMMEEAGFASGGVVGMHPGSPSTSDTIPAWLTPGEGIIKKSAMTKDVHSLVNRLNSGARYFADGGAVGVDYYDPKAKRKNEMNDGPAFVDDGDKARELAGLGGPESPGDKIRREKEVNDFNLKQAIAQGRAEAAAKQADLQDKIREARERARLEEEAHLTPDQRMERANQREKNAAGLIARKAAIEKQKENIRIANRENNELMGHVRDQNRGVAKGNAANWVQQNDPLMAEQMGYYQKSVSESMRKSKEKFDNTKLGRSISADIVSGRQVRNGTATTEWAFREYVEKRDKNREAYKGAMKGLGKGWEDIPKKPMPKRGDGMDVGWDRPIPKLSMGGEIARSGLAMVHAGEEVRPASVKAGSSNNAQNSTQPNYKEFLTASQMISAAFNSGIAPMLALSTSLNNLPKMMEKLGNIPNKIDINIAPINFIISLPEMSGVGEGLKKEILASVENLINGKLQKMMNSSDTPVIGGGF